MIISPRSPVTYFLEIEAELTLDSAMTGGGLPYSSDGKESACNAGDLGSIPGSGRSPEKEMARLTHDQAVEPPD